MTKRNIVHIEIPVAGGEPAGKFYQDLFGWKIQTDDNMHYTMWESDGSFGGFNEVGDEFKPGDVLIYVNSDDIEADLNKVKALGGTVVSGKTEIPTIGWFGVFKDPTGNRIALYTSMNPSAGA